jgi:hypothetical protein
VTAEGLRVSGSVPSDYAVVLEFRASPRPRAGRTLRTDDGAGAQKAMRLVFSGK